MRTIDAGERRARLAIRHRLTASSRPDDDVVAIARSVVALHATDPATVIVSALARMRTPDPAAVEQALYEDRAALRMLAMRRTLFVVAAEDVVLVQSAAADAVATAERKRLVNLLQDSGVTSDGERWLAGVTVDTLAAMDQLGEASATELAAAVPALATRVVLSAGKSYESTTSLASRILLVLGVEGHLVRGRPKGRWTSTQHQWAPAAAWLGRPIERVPVTEARAALARRWLECFGPGTVADVAWWTGWPLGVTRKALAALDTEEVDLDGEPGLVLAGDTEPPPAPEPWVALLPSLDPTIMGWKSRGWYLGEHAAPLFDNNGNAGPTVWADGRAVGAWIQRKDGEVVVRLVEDVGREHVAAIDEAAARLPEVLGGIVVTPRFHSHLSRELSR
jgi:hypothetical protein